MKLPSTVRWVIWVWCGVAFVVAFISNGVGQTAVQPNRQVAITIDFETLDNWRDFIDSADYIRVMRELRILGCHNFTANVWAPSKYFPESIRPENK